MGLIDSLKKAFSKPYKTISVAQAKELLVPAPRSSTSGPPRSGGQAGHPKPSTSPWTGCRPARRASKRPVR